MSDLDYDPNKDKREWWEYIVLFFACLLVAFMLTCCTTIKYVPVEKVVTKDSIVVKKEYDSIEIKVKEYVGHDTIYRDSIVVRYKYRTDTIYQSYRDSIPYPVEVVKEVDKPRTTYEKNMIRLGWSFIVVVIGYVLWRFIKWYIKLKR